MNFLFKKCNYFQHYIIKTNKNSSFCIKATIFSRTTECYEFFDIKNIYIGFTYLEILIFKMKSTKSVSFDLKPADISEPFLVDFFGVPNK